MQLVARLDSKARGPGFDIQTGHILLFLLLLIQDAVVSYWLKYMHLVLVNCLGGPSLSTNSVIWLTLLHLEQSKLHSILAVLSAIGLNV